MKNTSKKTSDITLKQHQFLIVTDNILKTNETDPVYHSIYVIQVTDMTVLFEWIDDSIRRDAPTVREVLRYSIKHFHSRYTVVEELNESDFSFYNSPLRQDYTLYDRLRDMGTTTPYNPSLPTYLLHGHNLTVPPIGSVSSTTALPTPPTTDPDLLLG